MLVAFYRHPTRNTYRAPWLVSSELLSHLVEEGLHAVRRVWRRTCSAAVRARILRQQRRLQTGYTLSAVTKCQALYVPGPSLHANRKRK